jgi:hypothetical protein
MKKLLSFGIAFLALAAGTNVFAAAFGSGNLVIYRVGDGTAPLTNTGNRVFLDEYTTNGVLVQSIEIPTNYFGANSPLLASGPATSEGEITRSADGRFIVLTGYGATLGLITNASLPSVSATTAPRVIGLVDGSGKVDTTTALTNTSFLSGSALRSAASTDGTNLWTAGDQAGISYTTRGGNSATRLSSFITNTRQVNVFNNQLYFSTGAGTRGIYVVTNGLPTVTNDVFFAILSNTQSTASSPYGFAFFKLSGGADPFDTLYIADDAGGNTAGAGAVYKWSLVSGTWVSNGFVQVDRPRGIVGTNESGTVRLYITGSGSLTDSSLNRFVDTTGFNADPGGGFADFLAAPSGNKAFRGIAFTPQGSEPSVPGQISVGPILGLFSSGFQGGPFNPSTINYSLGNPGTNTINWQIIADVNWLTFSSSNGTLNAGDTNLVTVSINANANSLTGGSNYFGIITFTNTTDGLGTTTRLSRLAVNSLAVSPSAGFTTSGPPGGPFTGSTVYTITNGSSVAQDWLVAVSVNWISFSATSGTLGAFTSTNITVSINANANSLAEDIYTAAISFTNVTLGNLVTTRTVTLQVGAGFCDDFSTFNEGDLVGQGNWLQHGLINTLPIQISGGKLTWPSDQQSDNQDAVRAFPTSTSNSVFWGMNVTFTNVPLGGVSFIGGLTTSNQGTITAQGTLIGNSFLNYRWGVTNFGTGFIAIMARTTGLGATPFIIGPATLVTGTQYRVIIQTDPLGSNTTVYVNPTNSNLSGQSPYLVAAPTGTLTGTQPGVTVGAVMMSQFGSITVKSPGIAVSKMCVSTNYTSVFNSLQTAPPADPFVTWQFNYFGSTNSAASQPGADPDGDGMINTNEFLAGFNPTNNAASLRIISIANQGSDVKVTFLGANGDSSGSPGPKTNVLEFTAGVGGSYSNNFASTGQSVILSGGTGSGVVTNMVDPGGATNVPSRYYRVRVLAP